MAAEEGQLISIVSVEHWKEQIEKSKGSTKLVVVDFTAKWCGPCKFIAPVFAQMAKEISHVTFLKVDVDDLQSIATEMGVEAMPTFLVIKEGNVVGKCVGADMEELQKLVEKHSA